MIKDPRLSILVLSQVHAFIQCETNMTVLQSYHPEFKLRRFIEELFRMP